jgi:amidohydrolase
MHNGNTAVRGLIRIGALPFALSMLLASTLVASAFAAEIEASALGERMDRRLKAVEAELVAIRHDIHRHPEPSGQEERTARLIADRLRKLGLDVRTGVGGHGVVAIIRGGKPGTVVAYRADIDAVLTDSPDPAPFRSERPDVRHICGHDVHVAVALGIAEALASIQSDLPGAVKLLFQPEEENSFSNYAFRSDPEIRGARAMIRDGALGDPRPTAIFAVHTTPLLTGQIAAIPGIALSGFDSVVVRLSGKGDLEAAAENVKRRFAAINTLPPREMLFADGQLRPVGDFVHTKVVDSSVEGHERIVRALVRASAEEQYAKAKAEILNGIGDLGMRGVSVRIDYQDRAAPDNYNDPTLIQASTAALREVVGAEGVLVDGETIPYFGEDFAFYLKEIPGVMFWLGVSRPEKGIVGMPHAPFYQADDDAILVGARAMSRVILSYLAAHDK